MRFLYSIILYLLTPLVLLRLLWSGLYNRDYWRRWDERFGWKALPPDHRGRIWIHAVSVGEVQAAVPLVQSLGSAYPQYRLLVTTVTPTGTAMVQQRFGSSVDTMYLPYDLPGAVNRFLDWARPLLLIVLETEIWPNLYHQCQHRKIGILMANARISERSYRGYKFIRRFTAQTLGDVDKIGAQSAADAERLALLGADKHRITVTGNLKFDMAVTESIARQAQIIKSGLFLDRKVWIAASTHDGEEEIILAAHKIIIDRFPECLLVLAPRHPERFARVARMCEQYGFSTVCRTHLSKESPQGCGGEVQVLVLDTLGELLVYYGAADVAFVGGSLLPAYGGHNVLEPVSLSVPVISGRYTSNFSEINLALGEIDAILQVADHEQLAQKVLCLLSDEKSRRQMGESGRKFIQQNQGSVGRVMDLVAEIMASGPTRQ